MRPDLHLVVSRPTVAYALVRAASALVPTFRWRAQSNKSVETSLDAARTSAYATKAWHASQRRLL